MMARKTAKEETTKGGPEHGETGHKVVRSRGRPKAGSQEADTSVGRDALIDATIDLLKDMPPAAITPVVVARAMGVHPSLIRYYFKNRATLLVAVAEKITQQFAQDFDLYTQGTGSPDSRLAGRIRTMVDLNATYPFFHQLFATEIVGSSDPAARAIITQLTNRGIGAYGSILRAGLGDGSLRAADPGLLYAAIVGMAEFFVSAHRQMEIAQGMPIDEPELREAYKSFVCDLVLNGLRNSGEG
jgi:TetR/AcrR family transcriptional regulator